MITGGKRWRRYEISAIAPTYRWSRFQATGYPDNTHESIKSALTTFVPSLPLQSREQFAIYRVVLVLPIASTRCCMSASVQRAAATILLIFGLVLWIGALVLPAPIGSLHRDQLRLFGTALGGSSIAAGIFVAAANTRSRKRSKKT